MRWQNIIDLTLPITAAIPPLKPNQDEVNLL